MTSSDPLAWAQAELTAAYADRRRGNEGRARVRARRIAGALAAEYLRRQGLPNPHGQNALRVLQDLWKRPELSGPTRLALSHLLMKVDVNFQLPPGVDLLQDVQLLARELLQVELSPPTTTAETNR